MGICKLVSQDIIVSEDMEKFDLIMSRSEKSDRTVGIVDQQR